MNQRETDIMKRQHGFTIVEILVALTLSLLLIIGVTEIFIGNRDTYRLQGGMAALQENARFAMDALRRDLSMAGYPSTGSFPAFDVDQTGDSGTSAPDSVAVTYWSNTDCGGVAASEERRTRAYTIAPGTTVLRCNNQELVDGVENMQFLYGIDTDNDGISNKFVTANKVTDWGTSGGTNVVAVRFALLFNSVEDISREMDTQQFILLEAPATVAANDFKRRRVYSGTVLIRNKANLYVPISATAAS